MSFAFDWPDYVVFGFWLVLYSLIGLYHRFRNEILSTINKCFGRQRQENVNEEDAEALFLGNRNLSLLPVLASLMASFLSAVALMGTTSEIYLYGIQFVFLIFGYLIAFPVAAEVYMPVFYKLKLNSAHEYLEFRFGKSIRWLTSLAFCIQMLVYTALALYAPSLAFSQVSGIPVWITVLSTGIVTTFYTTLGGIRAVVWIDLLQLILLTSGMLVAVIIGTVRIGGPQKLIEIAWTGKRLQTFDFNVNPLLHHTFWTLALGGAGMVLSIFGTNQTQVQRYLSCRNMETARRATLLNLPSNAVFLILEIIFGLVMYAYFSQCDPLQTGEVKKADQLLPYIIMVLFDGIPIIRGLFLSVIFAAALSTVSSGINSLAQVFLEDLIRPCLLHFRKKDLERRVQTYVAVLLSGFLGAVSVGLALLMQILSSGVLNFSFSLFGAIGGPILAVFTLGMIMPCINWKGALAGLVSSLGVGLWLSIEAILSPRKREKLPLSVSNCSGNYTFWAQSAGPMLNRELPSYSLSYLYYTLACLLTATVVGLAVSAISGFNSRSPVPRRLLAWQAYRCFRHLPSWLPAQTVEEERIHITEVVMFDSRSASSLENWSTAAAKYSTDI